MTDEDEVVRSPLRRPVTANRDGIPAEDLPDNSGGIRVVILSSEFRARLSWMTSPRPSSICFSKARMESMLISGPMLDNPTHVRYREMCWGAFTHIEDSDCSQLRGSEVSALIPGYVGRRRRRSWQWWGEEIIYLK